MSMTDRPGSMPSAAVGDTEVRGRASDTFRESRPVRMLRETKPSFLTTEFWAMVAGIAALIVLYNVTDNPDLTLWRTSLLCTVIASAYMVSRGWAKSGSHDDRVDRDHSTYR
jgi:hypothetical protein